MYLRLFIVYEAPMDLADDARLGEETCALVVAKDCVRAGWCRNVVESCVQLVIDLLRSYMVPIAGAARCKSIIRAELGLRSSWRRRHWQRQRRRRLQLKTLAKNSNSICKKCFARRSLGRPAILIDLFAKTKPN